jgi:hypothetical protein
LPLDLGLYVAPKNWLCCFCCCYVIICAVIKADGGLGMALREKSRDETHFRGSRWRSCSSQPFQVGSGLEWLSGAPVCLDSATYISVVAK